MGGPAVGITTMDSVPGLESSTLETADGKLREPHSEARPSRTNTTTTTTTSLSTVSPVRLEKSESETFVAPDGGYGWVVVVCQTTINGMTWGVNASYAVYLSHFTQSGGGGGSEGSLFRGTTTLQYTFVGGISVGMALAMSPFATLLNNKFGYRVPMLLGCVLEATAFICASFARTFWELFMSQGVLFGVSMGLLFAPSVGIPSGWFSKRRALATGICAGGSGIGGVIFNLGTNAMIQHLSLAWAYRITAIVVFVSTLTATLLTREVRPRESRKLSVARSLFDHSIFRFAGYKYILIWGLFSLLGYVTTQFTITKYAVSYLGLSQTQGSNLAALLSAGMAFGRPALGLIADRYGRVNAAIFFSCISGLMCLFIWMFAQSYGTMIFFALVNGMVCGTFWSSVIPVTAEIVGMAHLAAAASIVWLVMAVPSTFATTVALAIVGDSNDYKRLIGFAGAMYIAASIVLVGAKVKKQEERDGVSLKYKIWVKT